MHKTSIKILLLGLFILAFGSILFLQYKSYKSTKTLIESNENLLKEINYKNQFQYLQTHIVTLDKLVREAVITKGSVRDTEIRHEITLIDSSLDYIKKNNPDNGNDAWIDDLDSLVDTKINNGIDILNEYSDKGKQHAERLVDEHYKTNINSAIDKKIIALENKSEVNVQANVDKIDKNEKKALWSNIYITLGACILLLLALIYIYIKILQQQKLIDELNLSKEKEKKLTRIKDDFLANMSHEIRTPLNAILGFTSILEKENLNKKSADFVSTIKTSGLQLINIVDEILDISKIEEGMVRIENQPFSLAEVIHDIEQTFRNTIEEKGIKFNVNTIALQGQIFLGDQYRLTQILNNLLSNAVKFTAQGTIALQVSVKETIGHKSHVQFIVSDTGIGIAPDKLNIVFERFEQEDANITRRFGGTGLGLSIVKQLAELQHGTISVSSEQHKGCVFTVDMFYEISSQKASGVTTVEPDTSHDAETDAEILIVEDNKVNLKLLEYLFRDKAIKYKIAGNGREAIELLTGGHFDIILMDIQMPEMDGFTCTDIIRNKLKLPVPIIAMTAYTMQSEIEKCYASGMNAHISKPINEHELFSVIRKQTPVHKKKLINKNYLTELSKGDTAFIRNMLNEFMKQTAVLIAQLSQAFEQNDLEKVKTIAHSLKTNFGYIGIDNTDIMILGNTEQLSSLTGSSEHFSIINAIFEKAKIECVDFLKTL